MTPYKPQDDCTNSTEPSTPSKICSDRAPLLSPDKGKSAHSSKYFLWAIENDETKYEILILSFDRWHMVGLREY